MTRAQRRPRPGDASRQVLVNDAFWPLHARRTGRLGRLGQRQVTVDYPWIEGEAYTGHAAHLHRRRPSTHEVDVAAETPEADADFLGADGAGGPLRRRDPGGDRDAVAALACGGLDPRCVRFLLALTLGLAGASWWIDALLEGTEFAGAGLRRPSDGAALVFLACGGRLRRL